MRYTIIKHLQYNVWANTRLLATLQSVPDYIMEKEMNSSFQSITKTLLHMWDAQIIWLKRMQGENLKEWPSKNLHVTTNALLEGLINSTKNILAFIQDQPEHFLETKLKYKTLKGEELETVVEDILFHIVNHDTYHRGQITTMLRQQSVSTILSTDIIVYLRT